MEEVESERAESLDNNTIDINSFPALAVGGGGGGAADACPKERDRLEEEDNVAELCLVSFLSLIPRSRSAGGSAIDFAGGGGGPPLPRKLKDALVDLERQEGAGDATLPRGRKGGACVGKGGGGGVMVLRGIGEGGAPPVGGGGAPPVGGGGGTPPVTIDLTDGAIGLRGVSGGGAPLVGIGGRGGEEARSLKGIGEIGGARAIDFSRELREGGKDDSAGGPGGGGGAGYPARGGAPPGGGAGGPTEPERGGGRAPTTKGGGAEGTPEEGGGTGGPPGGGGGAEYPRGRRGASCSSDGERLPL